MHRNELTIDGRRISYLDAGGDGKPLLAMHGHLEEAATWAQLAADLAPQWRVIAPDQRGHGDSDRGPDYSLEGYVADAVAVIEHLGVGPVAILGHSGRGITAMRVAAQRPDLVSALIVEEIGAVHVSTGALDFVLGWPQQAPTRQELLDALGFAAPMFAEVLRENPDGSWRLPFVPQDMVDSENLVTGDYWADWLGSTCPALLIVGNKRPCVDPALAQAMVTKGANTTLVTLDTDHFAHKGDPAGFAAAVRNFLQAQ
ncbi:alpha/beta fold hydrolase [Nocardia sp. NBC_01009]|uniref:alpha/beta fold hydrolase n=1 Tax=Nocardia sp. NBC_01009 TaxID=2975996 RepID=UPI0038662BA6|nr:alpha/beta hydrolase [Nocardia sp. NBC_01009]